MPPKTDILPGFAFDPDRQRYWNLANGRFVSRSDINTLLRTEVQSAEARLRNLATAYHEGKIAPASFAEQMRTEVRRLALQNVALAAGGFDSISQSQYGRAGASLRDTYARIAGTTQDVVDGKVSLAQLLNRVDGYVGEARRLYYETSRDNQPQSPDGMTTIERRTLASGGESCDDCLNFYQMGWQLAGTLPSPSIDCKCGSHCRCDLVSRDVSTDELDQWIGSKG